MDRSYLEDLRLFHDFDCLDSKIPPEILEEIVAFHDQNYTISSFQWPSIIEKNVAAQTDADQPMWMPKHEIVKNGQKRGLLVFLFQDIILHEFPGEPHLLANASYYRNDGKKFIYLFLRPSLSSYVFNILPNGPYGSFNIVIDDAVNMFYFGAKKWEELYHVTPPGFEMDKYEKLYGKQSNIGISGIIKENFF